MQHPLGRARWDADRRRDDVRKYVLEHLHDEDAVLVAAETGDVKKGTRTVGVQRQFTRLVVQPVHDVAHWLAWSAWRRRHQARAQASHYRRQAANQT